MPFAHRPDARIWWEQSGTGDPVLLIMGHAYGAGMWHRTTPGLAASYRVIRFDNRGVGRSSDPPGPYPVRLMADDALAVLDAAGAASAHVYGVSLGGAIALQLALDHPGRVRSLILGCTAASAEGVSRGAAAHASPVPAARRRAEPDGMDAAVRAGHAGQPTGRGPADRPAHPVQRPGAPRPARRRRGLRRHRPARGDRHPGAGPARSPGPHRPRRQRPPARRRHRRSPAGDVPGRRARLHHRRRSRRQPAGPALPRRYSRPDRRLRHRCAPGRQQGGCSSKWVTNDSEIERRCSGS